jgi:hypothetical protein
MHNTGEQRLTDSSQSVQEGAGSYRKSRNALPDLMIQLLNKPALRTFLTGLALWGVFVLFLALVQFSTPNMPDNDGFYHIKLAYIMRLEGLKPIFPWLPLTILNPREYYDHHFLFHVALIPFTLGDLRLGAKWASVIFASLAFLPVWWLFRTQRISYAPLWAFGLLAVSEAFIYRMSITRAQSLSLAVLVIGLHWLLSGKHLRLFFLAFLYVWLYNAFPLLLIAAGIFVLAAWITDHRLDLRPVVFTGAGLGLGLLINPYFPYNLIFAYQHILPKLVEATSTSVGSEWYPYDTGQLLSNSPLALFLFVAGTLGLGLAGRKMELRTAVAFFFACLFGLMLFQSRRFIEYFPAFSLIFAAFALQPLIDANRNRPSHAPLVSASFRPWLPGILLLALLLPASWLTLQASQKSIQGSSPYQLFQGASAWLEANTPAGERVFQTDWDDFPRLFYYNTHNTYLIGLDPTYMQIYNSDLYDQWVAITRGRVEQPSLPILADFGARFVISDLEHDGFLRQAGRDPFMREVYRDDHAVVFEVLTKLE